MYSGTYTVGYQEWTASIIWHYPMSAVVANGTDRALSDTSLQDSGYFSRIFTSESGSTVQNSQIPRPYTKSYNHSLSDDSTVYTRQNDVLPVPRPPVYTNSHAQGSSQAPGHLQWQIGRYSSAPYTAVPTIIENVPRSTSSSQRPSCPPPYEAVIADDSARNLNRELKTQSRPQT
ncbi:hypothetical protein F5880DRAFT_1508885 [Lentinula raphanica]|nr:hypothetical protein F5880DRAFT_1508885 [Lentinula raphanica]